MLCRSTAQSIVAAAIVCLPLFPSASAQQPPPEQLQKLKERQEYLQAFAVLSPAEKADVWRRRYQWCLDNLKLSEEQRTVVKQALDRVRAEDYRTRTPAEEQAFRELMNPIYEHARSVLGQQLWLEVFIKGPSAAEIETYRKEKEAKK